MPTDPAWRVLLVIALFWLIWVCYYRQHAPSNFSALPLRRLLKPRTPADCSACRQHAVPTDTAMAHPPVTPWSAIKSQRGAMGRFATQAFACPNRQSAVLSNHAGADPCTGR